MSDFVKEQALHNGLTELNLRLANCLVYAQKIANTEDKDTITSHYDLILSNLKLAATECVDLYDNLSDKKVRKAFIDTYEQNYERNGNSFKEELKLKCQSYKCSVRNSRENKKATITGKILIKSIKPTKKEGRYDVDAEVTFRSFFGEHRLNTNFTYNTKAVAFTFNFEMNGKKYYGAFNVK